MKKILLIEDDQSLRENLAEILRLSSFIVAEAGNGKDGVEKALREKPDLILCDVMMPGLDGFSVLHILSRHPDTFAIPFIFITALTEATDQRKAMLLGADDYLTKPILEKDLLDAIEVRLKKSENLKKNGLHDKTGLHDYIQELDESVSFHLVANRDIHHYKKRHLLYSQGDRPAFVYFVASGKLKEFIISDEGKELITNIYTKGDFVGYTTVLEDIPYPESIQVMENAELVVIPKSDFLELINTDRMVARRFISLLSNDILQMEGKLLNLAYNSLRRKVARGIINVIDKFKDRKEGKPVIQISRADLANIVGAAQESMIRTLKEFRTENLIDIEEGTIYVLNEEKLRRLS